MRILKINRQSNGAYKNQSSRSFKKESIPIGWAIIPENLETPNFPFGEATIEEVNGVMTVTSWAPGTIPQVEKPVSKQEQMRADIDYLALMTGVKL